MHDEVWNELAFKTTSITTTNVRIDDSSVKEVEPSLQLNACKRKKKMVKDISIFMAIVRGKFLTIIEAFYTNLIECWIHFKQCYSSNLLQQLLLE